MVLLEKIISDLKPEEKLYRHCAGIDMYMCACAWVCTTNKLKILEQDSSLAPENKTLL